MRLTPFAAAAFTRNAALAGLALLACSAPFTAAAQPAPATDAQKTLVPQAQKDLSPQLQQQLDSFRLPETKAGAPLRLDLTPRFTPTDRNLADKNSDMRLNRAIIDPPRPAESGCQLGLRGKKIRFTCAY